MSSLIVTPEIMNKYDVAGPRYTSYPTAPVWEDLDSSLYIDKLTQFGQKDKPLSLYVHVPFCKSLCTYCGCTVAIRKPWEKYGDEYLKAFEDELNMLSPHLGDKKNVRQYHWGGGTPTFLSCSQIEKLFGMVQDHFKLEPDGEVAIEVDPRTVDREKLELLRSLGFNRISMGVQDFDEKVQIAVNRIHSFEEVAEVFNTCRDLGFDSINIDLIYGLPKQSVASFSKTLEKITKLKPDRIALYSFAHIPWLKPQQKKIDINDLPRPEEKLAIFLKARNYFLEHDYEAIAMDHFALSTDKMSEAFRKGRLHRNFMGYTLKPADDFIGLGSSSIGFIENTFIHNAKNVYDYYDITSKGKLPVVKGKVLSRDDILRQWIISSLMCRFQIDKSEFYDKFTQDFDQTFSDESHHLQQCAEDGLITLSENTIRATELGKLFIRNVCMGFDAYLKEKKGNQRFSRTI